MNTVFKWWPVLLLMMLAACSPRTDKALQIKQSEALITHFIDAMEEEKMQEIVSCFAPDSSVVLMMPGAEARGQAEIKELLSSFLNQYAQPDIEISNLLILPDKCGKLSWFSCQLSLHYDAEGFGGRMEGIALSGVIAGMQDHDLKFMQLHISMPVQY